MNHPVPPQPPLVGFATVLNISATSTNVGNIEAILKGLTSAGYRIISRVAPAAPNQDGSIAGVWILGLPAVATAPTLPTSLPKGAPGDSPPGSRRPRPERPRPPSDASAPEADTAKDPTDA